MSVQMSEMMKDFIDKYNIDEEGQKELIQIFNTSLIEISSKILEKYDGKDNNKPKNVNNINKKFASKKAEEYAYENNLTIDDFDIDKISKKDVEEKVRKITKEKTSNLSTIETHNTTKKIERKVLCCGLTKKGEQCTRAGTLKPDGAKKMYCFRHADEWNTFECESDSSDDEELKIENITKCNPCNTVSEDSD